MTLRERFGAGLGWAMLAGLLLALILVPFALWEEELTAWSLTLVEAAGGRVLLASIVTGLLAADVVLPIPSSLLSIGAGAALGFLPGAAAVAVGLTVGGLIGHRLGLVARRPVLARLVGHAQELRLRALLDRYGVFAIVLMRPVPVLAEASVILAGMGGMPLRHFLPACLLSSTGVALAYAGAGAWAVDQQIFPLAVACAMALPGVAWLAGRLLNR